MKRKDLILVLAAFTGSALLSGCGATAYREASVSGGTSNSTQNNNSNDASDDSDDFSSPLANTLKGTFEIGGQTAAISPIYQKKITVSTNNKLRIRLKPASNRIDIVTNMAGGASNYAYVFGCLRMEVVVNGEVQSTGVMKTPGMSSYSSFCASAGTQSDVLDFSSAVGTSGSTQITVRIAEFDYKCYWENASIGGWNPNTSCVMQKLYEQSYNGIWSYMKVQASYEIEVNGTKAIQ